MKHKVLLAAAFVLLTVLVPVAARADGGCLPARAAALSTPAVTLAARAGLDLQGLETAKPVWLTVSDCCTKCNWDYNDCLLACPPMGSGNHFSCIAACRTGFNNCGRSCPTSC